MMMGGKPVGRRSIADSAYPRAKIYNSPHVGIGQASQTDNRRLGRDSHALHAPRAHARLATLVHALSRAPLRRNRAEDDDPVPGNCTRRAVGETASRPEAYRMSNCSLDFCADRQISRPRYVHTHN